MSNVYLASDHAGFELKEKIKEALDKESDALNIALIDCGAEILKDGDDYPIYMSNAARSVAEDALHNPSMAILFGGSGTGEAIVANRYRHVRACVYNGQSLEIVKLAREHNDANVIAIGARFVDFTQALDAVRMFLSTPFSHDERHAERIVQIEEVTSN